MVALPMDRWSEPYPTLAFEGGGLTFWDGKKHPQQQDVIHYDTRSGDIAFIDRYVHTRTIPKQTNNTGNDLEAFHVQPLLGFSCTLLPSFLSGRSGIKQIRLPKELGGLWSYFTKCIDPFT